MSARLFVAVALGLLAAPARAESKTEFTIAALAGYAEEFHTLDTGALNRYGYGLGARAGVSTYDVYAGLAFIHGFGTHESATGPGVTYEARYRTTLVAPELGWDLRLGRWFRVRPYLSAAMRFAYGYTSVQGVTVDDNNTGIAAVPGTVAMVRLGDMFAGLDARMMLTRVDAPRSWVPGVFATVGWGF
ncbi:MAG: outer membrane beta-barrel protein [Deltaproteobacteria bacterium]|nr:outer membrane beta-barrel protein [Deltaproteobacteria bacterium]